MAKLSFSEPVLILSGLGILASVPLLFVFGSFELWVASKVLYGVGTALFLVNR